MSKIAINIALIPSNEVCNKAIEINKKLVKQFNSSLVLDKEHHFPHVTLLQMVIELEKLSEVESVLKQVASEFSPLELKITGTKIYREPPTSSLVIEFSKELQSLHEQIVEKLSIFRCDDVKKEYFFEEPSDRMVNYVKHFNEKNAFDNYWPHVTLGKGRAKQVEQIEFKASEIVIAHEGAHGTCAKTLKIITLKRFFN